MNCARTDRGEAEPGVLISIFGAAVALLFIHSCVGGPVPDPPAQSVVNSASNGAVDEMSKGGGGNVTLVP